MRGQDPPPPQQGQQQDIGSEKSKNPTSQHPQASYNQTKKIHMDSSNQYNNHQQAFQHNKQVNSRQYDSYTNQDKKFQNNKVQILIVKNQFQMIEKEHKEVLMEFQYNNQMYCWCNFALVDRIVVILKSLNKLYQQNIQIFLFLDKIIHQLLLEWRQAKQLVLYKWPYQLLHQEEILSEQQEKIHYIKECSNTGCKQYQVDFQDQTQCKVQYHQPEHSKYSIMVNQYFQNYQLVECHKCNKQ